MEANQKTPAFTMDWSNLNFRAKDVLAFLIYVITAAFFVSRIQISVERQSDKIENISTQFEDFKQETKNGGKDYQALFQNFQNQINLNTTQIMLVKQQVEQLKSQIK